MQPGRLVIAAVAGTCLVVGACTPSSDTPGVTGAATTPPSPEVTEDDATTTPGLALVETPLATGTGIVVDGGLLVTTAHVVWPHRRVDVRFVDGSTASDAEVVGVDWVADLAIVDLSGFGSVSPPLAIADSTAVGDEVMLVGFPSGDLRQVVVETEVRGTRTWAAAGLEYLETGGPIGGGHSGGALVDSTGSVIGIITTELPDGDVLSLGGADLAERIDGMVAGRDPGRIGDRWLEDLQFEGIPTPSVHALDESVWVLRPEAGAEVVLTTTAGWLSGSVVGPDGFLEATLTEDEMAFVATVGGPHFAAVVPGPPSGAVVELAGTVELTRLGDPDHGEEVARGETIFANIDRPGDLDWFVIELQAGESIEVEATSPNADLALVVGPIEAITGPAATGSSDGAAGVLGSDARVTFVAERTGRHVIVAFDETQFGPGAYALRIGD